MKRTLLLTLLLSSFVIWHPSFAADAQRKPNILFILADDLGAHDPHAP